MAKILEFKNLSALFLTAICLFILNIPATAQKNVKPATSSGGAISGRLLKSDGKPLPYTEIEIVPVFLVKQVQHQRFWATTDGRGNFSFKNIPKAEYTLSINFDEKPTDLSPYATVFYPNTSDRAQAEKFKIEAAATFAGLVFKLPPPLALMTVKGRVVGVDLKPIAGVYVNLVDADYDELNFDFRVRTDKNGNFTLKSFADRQYVVTAIDVDLPKTPNLPFPMPRAFGKSDVFRLDANTPDIIVIIENPRRVIKDDGKLG